MQSSLNNQKHHSFNRSVLAHSEVTPVKKNRALGTITKSCSTVDSKEKIFDKNKAREYRKVTTQLKERAGEILYKPNEKKQHRVCACGKCRIDGTAPVGIKYNATKEVAHYTISNGVVLFGFALIVRTKLLKSVKKNCPML